MYIYIYMRIEIIWNFVERVNMRELWMSLHVWQCPNAIEPNFVWPHLVDEPFHILHPPWFGTRTDIDAAARKRNKAEPNSKCENV